MPTPNPPTIVTKSATGSKLHYIIAGGTSVNENQGHHDRYPLNFLDAAYAKAKQLKADDKSANVIVLMYTPSYEARVRDQESEHERVTGCPKWKTWLSLCKPLDTRASRTNVDGEPNAEYFEDVMEERAKEVGFQLVPITSRSELTSELNDTDRGLITSVSYFGHSTAESFLLDYGIDGLRASADRWGFDQIKDVSAGRFAPGARFASYGCKQGDPGGLAQAVSFGWKIETTGSQGNTDYGVIGGGATYPDSTSGYVTYTNGTLQPAGTPSTTPTPTPSPTPTATAMPTTTPTATPTGTPLP